MTLYIYPIGERWAVADHVGYLASFATAADAKVWAAAHRPGAELLEERPRLRAWRWGA